jgi:hypothetical protein
LQQGQGAVIKRLLLSLKNNVQNNSYSGYGAYVKSSLLAGVQGDTLQNGLRDINDPRLLAFLGMTVFSMSDHSGGYADAGGAVAVIPVVLDSVTNGYMPTSPVSIYNDVTVFLQSAGFQPTSTLTPFEFLVGVEYDVVSLTDVEYLRIASACTCA